MGQTIVGAWQAFLPMMPPTVTHNDLEAYLKRGKGGRMVPAIRKGDRLREAEDAISARVMAAGPPAEPLGMEDGSSRVPLREVVTLCYPVAGHDEGQPMTAKPDLDNVVKTLNDVLEACGVIVDDRLVADLRVSKAWSEPAGIYIHIEEIIEGES